MKIVLIILFVLSVSTSVSSYGDEHHHEEEHEHEHEHEEEHHHEEERFSPEMAIQEVNEAGGIRLSKEAKVALEIKTKKVTNEKLTLPLEALVVFKESKGFYILRKDFYYFMPLKDFVKNKNEIELQVNELKPDDEIVVHGVELLRVADIFAKDDAEYGHAH